MKILSKEQFRSLAWKQFGSKGTMRGYIKYAENDNIMYVQLFPNKLGVVDGEIFKDILNNSLKRKFITGAVVLSVDNSAKEIAGETVDGDGAYYREEPLIMFENLLAVELPNGINLNDGALKTSGLNLRYINGESVLDEECPIEENVNFSCGKWGKDNGSVSTKSRTKPLKDYTEVAKRILSGNYKPTGASQDEAGV